MLILFIVIIYNTNLHDDRISDQAYKPILLALVMKFIILI